MDRRAQTDSSTTRAGTRAERPADPYGETLVDLETASLSASFEEIEGFNAGPGLTIVAHPDVERVGDRVALLLAPGGAGALLSRLQPLFSQARHLRRRQPLADVHLSRRPLRILPAGDDGLELLNDQGLHVEVDGELLGPSRVVRREEIERGVVVTLARHVVLLLHLIELIPLDGPDHGLVGESVEIQKLRRAITAVADLDVSVLLRGETGTGKELAARAIVGASGRRDRPFVPVNMAALPPSLAAGELFGAVRGAFTGADRDRDGHFARADGGTLFLDEIGETPLEVQPLLLRALETGMISPLGAGKPRTVDVRLLAATDADLETRIERDEFRAPLLHRLAGSVIHLPPLRHRRDDIARLLVAFLREELEEAGAAGLLERSGRTWCLSASLAEKLLRFDWPGNVRQLRNVARQIAIASRGAKQLVAGEEVEALLATGSTASAASVRAASVPAASVPDLPAPAASPPHLAAPVAAASVEPAPRSWRRVVRTLVALDWRVKDGAREPDAWSRRASWTPALRALIVERGGHEVSTPDDVFLVFERPADGVAFALGAQSWCRGDAGGGIGEGDDGLACGILTADVRFRTNGPGAVARGAGRLEVEGEACTTVRRLAALARPRQTLVNHAAYVLARDLAVDERSVRWHDHGDLTLPDGGETFHVFEAGFEHEAPIEPPAAAKIEAGRSYRAPSKIDEDELVETLRAHRFRVQPTARALGISRTSLYALIEQSTRLRKAKDLTAEEISACHAEQRGNLDRMAEALEVSRKGLSRRMTELQLSLARTAG